MKKKSVFIIEAAKDAINQLVGAVAKEESLTLTDSSTNGNDAFGAFRKNG